MIKFRIYFKLQSTPAQERTERPRSRTLAPIRSRCQQSICILPARRHHRRRRDVRRVYLSWFRFSPNWESLVLCGSTGLLEYSLHPLTRQSVQPITRMRNLHYSRAQERAALEVRAWRHSCNARGGGARARVATRRHRRRPGAGRLVLRERGEALRGGDGCICWRIANRPSTSGVHS